MHVRITRRIGLIDRCGHIGNSGFRPSVPVLLQWRWFAVERDDVHLIARHVFVGQGLQEIRDFLNGKITREFEAKISKPVVVLCLFPPVFKYRAIFHTGHREGVPDRSLRPPGQSRPFGRAQHGHHGGHRLQIGGVSRDLFMPGAYEVIHKSSYGVARRINNLCDLCLLEGFQTQAKTITEELVHRVL